MLYTNYTALLIPPNEGTNTSYYQFNIISSSVFWSSWERSVALQSDDVFDWLLHVAGVGEPRECPAGGGSPVLPDDVCLPAFLHSLSLPKYLPSGCIPGRHRGLSHVRSMLSEVNIKPSLKVQRMDSVYRNWIRFYHRYVSNRQLWNEWINYRVDV